MLGGRNGSPVVTGEYIVGGTDSDSRTPTPDRRALDPTQTIGTVEEVGPRREVPPVTR